MTDKRYRDINTKKFKDATEATVLIHDHAS